MPDRYGVHELVQSLERMRTRGVGLDGLDGLARVHTEERAAPVHGRPRCRRGSRRRSAPAPAPGRTRRGSGAAARRSGRARSTAAAGGGASGAGSGAPRGARARARAPAEILSSSTWVCSSCRCSERRKLAGSRRIATMRASGCTSAIARRRCATTGRRRRPRPRAAPSRRPCEQRAGTRSSVSAATRAAPRLEAGAHVAGEEPRLLQFGQEDLRVALAASRTAPWCRSWRARR